MTSKKATGWGAILLILVGLGWFSKGKFCQMYPDESICAPAPIPTPLPTPKPTPIPTPEPTPIPTPEPTPNPTPTPIVTSCPYGTCPWGDRYINAKVHGQGADSTERCRNQGYCEKATGIPGVRDCALGVEGTQARIDCELAHSPGCLKWYYRTPENMWERCGVMEHPIASCDHYDGYIDWKGPYTGYCETRPDGYPIAGNTVFPHGKTGFKACDTAGMTCSNVLELDR